MRFACYKVRPQCHRLYRFLCTLQLGTIPHCPKCLHVPGLIHQSPIHRVSLLHRHRLHHGHQDHSHLEDRAAVRQMLEEVKVVEVVGEILETQAWWQHVGYLTLRAMVTRMEKKQYDPNTKLAVKLIKSLYGHPQSGNLWQNFLETQLQEMGGVQLESYPSNFIFRYGDNSEHTLILNIYVDDLTLAGGNKEVQTQFWKDLKFRVKIDPEQYIDGDGVKILGRVHSIQRNPTQVVMTYDMRSYSKGIISFYCEITGMRQEKLRKVSTPCLLENQTTDEELAHEGEMHAFAARILMKCLWLSRLARPDISFAVQRLASRITRWTKWEDRQMLRLVSYLNSTSKYVMLLQLNLTKHRRCWYTLTATLHPAHTHQKVLLVLFLSFELVQHVSHYYGHQRNRVQPQGVQQKRSLLHPQARCSAKHLTCTQWLNL